METLEEKIETGRHKIQRLLESQTTPQRLPSKARIIAGLQDDIARMRAKDWTWDGIAKALKDEGVVDATAETIRLVFDGKSKKKSAKNASKKPKRDKAVKTQEPDKIREETPKENPVRTQVLPIPRAPESAMRKDFPSDSDL